MSVEILTVTQTWVCPPNFIGGTLKVECWAGGGAGDVAVAESSGGGGGAYARLDALAVTPGTSYTATVGVGGVANAGVGGDTWFSTAATVFAKGGNDTFQGQGGLAANCIGDVVYAGGSSSVAPGVVGGGSSSAGSASNGVDAIGSAGGIAPFEGGDGGAGIAGGGEIGVIPGGGGGGALNPNTAGNGARGQIRLTYSTVSARPTQLIKCCC